MSTKPAEIPAQDYKVADIALADFGRREIAIAETETGAERRIAVANAGFAAGETEAEAVFDLPPELIREVSRFILADR
ncbi:MAG: hypothetical protein AAFX58_04475, partial [Pseudomonadota bacterium]